MATETATRTAAGQTATQTVTTTSDDLRRRVSRRSGVTGAGGRGERTT
ncbi:MAG: hypothetical protein MPJ82_07835 [Alphaproteobacteria bacterium]|nr:hypothetical protein [Alphaproteobacteria bacterium]MDA7999988.1 hypothetical protein [Alphaproteobacteria bacterium]MDA8009818.1 hypothetical protein [Alphaproteobacteria bacterium]